MTLEWNVSLFWARDRKLFTLLNAKFPWPQGPSQSREWIYCHSFWIWFIFLHLLYFPIYLILVPIDTRSGGWQLELDHLLTVGVKNENNNLSATFSNFNLTGLFQCDDVVNTLQLLRGWWLLLAIGGAETISNLRLRYQIPDHFNSGSEAEADGAKLHKICLGDRTGDPAHSKENSASQQ